MNTGLGKNPSALKEAAHKSTVRMVVTVTYILLVCRLATKEREQKYITLKGQKSKSENERDA